MAEFLKVMNKSELPPEGDLASRFYTISDRLGTKSSHGCPRAQKCYKSMAKTAASLRMKGRSSPGHRARHSFRWRASESFVPVEP